MGVERVTSPRTDHDMQETGRRLQQLGVELEPRFESGMVLTIPLAPGLRTESVKAQIQPSGAKVVVMESLGIGNVPDLPGDFDMVEVIKYATSLGMLVVLTSKFAGGDVDPSHYATGVSAQRAGAVSLGNMTPEAVLAKLYLLLASIDPSEDLDTFRQALQIDLAGETGAPGKGVDSTLVKIRDIVDDPSLFQTAQELTEAIILALSPSDSDQ